MLLQEGGDHDVVEGDLQAVLHLGSGRAFHIGDEQMESACVVAVHAEDVDVTPDCPTGYFHRESYLK